MRRAILVFLFCLVSSNAFPLGLHSGADVLEACAETQSSLAGKAVDERKAEACIHFLMGFDSGQSIVSLTSEVSGIYCQPEGSNIGKMVDLVTSYLSANAEYKSAPAGIAVWKALSNSWPCDEK